MSGKHQTKFRAGQTVWIPIWVDIGGKYESGFAHPIRVTSRQWPQIIGELRQLISVGELKKMVKRRLTLSSSCSIYPSKRLAERYFKLRGVRVVNNVQ